MQEARSTHSHPVWVQTLQRQEFESDGPNRSKTRHVPFFPFTVGFDFFVLGAAEAGAGAVSSSSSAKK